MECDLIGHWISLQNQLRVPILCIILSPDPRYIWCGLLLSFNTLLHLLKLEFTRLLGKTLAFK